MKRIWITSLLIAALVIKIQAQSRVDVPGVKVTDEHIFFIVDKETKMIKSFTSKNENQNSIKSGERMFSLKHSFSNLYFRWINPVKYRFEWKDSIYNDERDEAIKKFIEALAGQFGSPVLNLNKEASAKAVSKVKGSKPPLTKDKASVEIILPDNGFNNVELTRLFLDIRANQDLLDSAEIVSINELIQSVSSLDKKIASDYSKEADRIFKGILGIEKLKDVDGAVGTYEGEVSNYETALKESEEDRQNVIKEVGEVKVKSVIIKTYLKNGLDIFLTQAAIKINADKAVVAKLTPVIDLLKKSKNEDNESPNQPGYFLIRDVGFDRGKAFETVVTVSEFEYKEEKKEFVRKQVLATSKLKFKRYDFFAVSVSAGIFYGNTTLKGFGVENAGSDFKVVEDDVKENTPVLASFLNFNFGTGSQFVSPLIQIGVDPSKKRPFLLFGGGFSIPVARIAFSAGTIMTWDQTLDNLAPGSIIKATNELDDDIKYKFDMKPKGWYFGVQYNF
jgi:hypothetical protein